MSSNAEPRSRRGFWWAGGSVHRYKLPSASLRLCVKNLQLVLFVTLGFSAPLVFAEPAYTNHAGNVVSGWPVKLTAKQVTLAERVATNDCQLTTNHYPLATNHYQLTTTYPLSIFPESEQRRIAADFLLRQGSGGQVGLLRIPDAVKRAISGADKAMERSRKRAEKGLCTKEESDDFCAKSAAALKTYLDKQVKEGVITPAERKALGR